MLQLRDIAGVGKAAMDDLATLGIGTVNQLAAADPDELYERLCRITGANHDICCLDLFRCAAAQARNPDLPEEQRRWWYWSRQRKANGAR